MQTDVEKQLSFTFFSYHKRLGIITEIFDLAEDLELTKGNPISNSQALKNPTPVTKCPGLDAEE